MDSWLGSAIDPVTLHKYTYGNLDPVNHTDSSGHFGLMEFGAANSIATELTLMQVNAGTSLLDFSLTGNVEMPSASSLGIAAVSAIAPVAGFKILKLLSNKFRQACNSFTEDTPVLTDSGPKATSDLAIGDKVWAFDDETGQLELQDVVHFIEHSGTYTLVHLTTDSGEVISATAGHPFYVKTEHGWQWIEASEITKGTIVRDREGRERTITAVSASQFTGPVFNLTVANDHTYLVGENGVVVHNAGVCGLITGYRKDHILHGDATGGFHHRPTGVDPPGRYIERYVQGKEYKDPNTPYKARVYISDTGRFKTSSFFPDAWSEQRVFDEINSAYIWYVSKYGPVSTNGSPIVGRSASGIDIKIILTNDSSGLRVHSAYPNL